MSAPRQQVLIATPAHGYAVTTVYHQSVLALHQHFAPEAVQFESKLLSIALLSVARNFLASWFLENRQFTHLLFVDADMGFAPTLVQRMLDLKQPLVGSFCPSRAFDLTALHAQCRRVDDPKLAANLAQPFVGQGGWLIGEPDPNDPAKVQVKVEKGFARARQCGTGLMLIAREVLEAMRERQPELWVADCGPMYRGLGLKGGVLQCFESVRDADGLYVGEDVAFCRRWVEGCGGEIWVNVAEDVTHVGHSAHTGNYLVKLQHGI